MDVSSKSKNDCGVELVGPGGVVGGGVGTAGGRCRPSGAASSAGLVEAPVAADPPAACPLDRRTPAGRQALRHPFGYYAAKARLACRMVDLLPATIAYNKSLSAILTGADQGE